MALSFVTTPTPVFIPIYKPIVYEVNSDDVDIVQVICDVFINGAFQFSIDKSEDLNSTRDFTFDLSDACQTLFTGQVLPKNPISGNSIAFVGDSPFL